MASPKFKDLMNAAAKSKRKKFQYGEKTYEANQTQKKTGGDFKLTAKRVK